MTSALGQGKGSSPKAFVAFEISTDGPSMFALATLTGSPFLDDLVNVTKVPPATAEGRPRA